MAGLQGVVKWNKEGMEEIRRKGAKLGIKGEKRQGRRISRDSSVVSVLDLKPARWWVRSFHVATVGQLLFAPWAWAYSALHP